MPEPDDRSGAADLAARFAGLEARVTALEQAAVERAGPAVDAGAGSGPAPAYDPEVFWALEGLRARVDDELGAVLLTGSVRLPTGEEVAWQDGQLTQSLLEADWTQGAEAIAALGHPVRLTLLREVLTGTRTTAELGAHEALGTSGQLYHHLRALTATGWLRTVGRGRYEVPAGRVVPLLVVLAATQP